MVLKEKCHHPDYCVTAMHRSLSYWQALTRFQKCNFRSCFTEWYLQIFVGWCPQMNATAPYWWWVNISLGNGLVPSGNKPLPQPNVDSDLCRHVASLGANALMPSMLIKLTWRHFYFHQICSVSINAQGTLSIKFTHFSYMNICWMCWL